MGSRHPAITSVTSRTSETPESMASCLLCPAQLFPCGPVGTEEDPALPGSSPPGLRQKQDSGAASTVPLGGETGTRTVGTVGSRAGGHYEGKLLRREEPISKLTEDPSIYMCGLSNSPRHAFHTGVNPWGVQTGPFLPCETDDT